MKQALPRRAWLFLAMVACAAVWEARADLFEIHDAALARHASLDAAHRAP
ncbi:hypothetical protein LJR168_003234 [Pseudoxanthomonas sp. LjRoot168]